MLPGKLFRTILWKRELEQEKGGMSEYYKGLQTKLSFIPAYYSNVTLGSIQKYLTAEWFKYRGGCLEAIWMKTYTGNIYTGKD